MDVSSNPKNVHATLGKAKPPEEGSKTDRLVVIVIVVFALLHIVHIAMDIIPHQTYETNVSSPSVDSMTSTTFSLHKNNNGKSVKEPTIQVAVATSPLDMQHARILYTNSVKGWHQDFDNISYYTLDELPESSPLAQVVISLETAVFNRHDLYLAALQAVYGQNPASEWYLLVEDDTIIVKENLLHAIQTLNLNSTHEIMQGVCVGTTTAVLNGTQLPLHILVGDAGILLSNGMLKAMIPHIRSCRKKVRKLQHQDQQLSACIQYIMNRSKHVMSCEMSSQYQLSYGKTTVKMQQYGNDQTVGKQRIISLHEPDPKNAEVLYHWISLRPGRDVTLQGMTADHVDGMLEKTNRRLR